MNKRMWSLLVVTLIVLMVTACGGSPAPAQEAAPPQPAAQEAENSQPPADTPTAQPEVEESAPQTDTPTAQPEVEESAPQADTPATQPEVEESAGSEPLVVKVLGPFTGDEAARFEASIGKFEQKTGIDVIYEATSDFNTVINVRVQGGNPPDVAPVPQPGVMKQFADAGQLVPLWPEIMTIVEKNYAPAWIDLASYNGNTYGVFHRVNIKSLVFYPKKAFKAAGYQIPETWDDMIALSDQIVADGGTPWCVGIESGGATGWVATDWMEDIMLRTGGPEVYDKWVNHEIPFDDPAVVKAAEIMGDIWFNPDYVLGGTPTILATFMGDSPLPMFDNPPGCYLHRQGNFITGFFPDNVVANLDEEVGVFALPAIDETYGVPGLGGGDQFIMFNDRPEVRQFMEFLATADSTVEWAQAGGALFPHKDQDLSNYPNEVTRVAAKALLDAKVFRFDASDLMPSEVGAGSFWEGMVDYVSAGDTSAAKDVLGEIEASWPK